MDEEKKLGKNSSEQNNAHKGNNNKTDKDTALTQKTQPRKTLSLKKDLENVSLNTSGGLMARRRKIKTQADVKDVMQAQAENANAINSALEALKKAKEALSKDALKKQEVDSLRQENFLSQKARQEEIEKIHLERLQKEEEEKAKIKQQRLEKQSQAAEVKKPEKSFSQSISTDSESRVAKTQHTFTKERKVGDDETEEKNKKLRLKDREALGARNRITVQDAWLQTQSDYDDLNNEGFRYKKQRKGSAKKKSSVVHDIEISNDINIIDLAHKIGIKSGEVLKILNKLGTETKNLHQILDPETAVLIVEELGHKARFVPSTSIEDEIMIADDATKLETRSPVVSVMGHVDHGKTSLLDALRNTNFADGESGGITQHISAYRLHAKNGDITFLDTPGHAAFASMRARGANLTDIVLLVVAADDGVMEQTIEAINHAKEANTPIIVVINKIDKPQIDIARLKSELTQHEVYTEDMGGSTIVVEVSAKNKIGLDSLVEAILLQASIMDLKAQVDRKAQCRVVESHMDKGLGAIATLIVETGTLHVGEYFVSGQVYGRVRGIISDRDESLKQACPAQPVLVFGFNGLPNAGDDFIIVSSEQVARSVAEYRHNLAHKNIDKAHVSAKDLEDLFNKTQKKTLDIIVKADTDGSAEALVESLKAINHDEVGVNIVQCGVGYITESDVMLAQSIDSLIIGFNVKALTGANKMAASEETVVITRNIIYELIEDVKERLSLLLEPDITFEEQGRVEVRKVFEISHLGRVAGCYVQDGVVRNDSFLKIERKGKIIFEDKIKTLKKTTDEAKEIKKGFECGILFEKFDGIEQGDIILAYNKIVSQRKL